ncbi:conjugal transfer protein TraF [Thiomicrospira sp.]|uniref:conjugal transfer protein TraF n=1 Tax=Thiomicrospira sp. TaxID=935 RepID=UPI002F9563AB
MMKRKLLALAVTGALSSSAMATTFHNQGSVLGYGDAGNNHTIFANFKNPAFLGGDDTNREIGLGASVGIDAEYKEVDGVGDNFDTLDARIAEIEANFAGDVAAAEADIEEALNTFFQSNENLNINLKASGSVPLVVQTTNNGGFMLAASVTTGTNAKFLRTGDADVTVTPVGPSDFTYNLNSESAMLFSAFQLAEVSLAYSADLNRFFKPQNGQVNAGIRLKAMSGQFNHYGLEFDSFLDNQNGEFEDRVSDGLDEVTTFENTESQFGVDLGLQYIAKNYLLGLSLENINSPSFKYNMADADTQAFATAGYLEDEITFEPKARLEAATYSKNRRWTLAGFYDLTKTMDITGLETKKAGVAVSYASNRWFLPDLRAGYTNESAGNEMSRIHGGLTIGPVSVDVAANSFDFGEDVDNSIAANVSVELTF